MPKQSLRNTNPYLKGSDKGRELIALSVSSSSAIEDIRLSPQEILSWQHQVNAPRSARGTSDNLCN
ncbi:MAG TPA: hypothetical protein HPP76_03480 [Desulfuromonadales bacterium]|nr:hypothetical protein [Desulfuromonadales bacterium]